MELVADVILPAYNGSRVIRRAIESALLQDRVGRIIVAARRLWCNRHSRADVTSMPNVRYLVGPGYRHGRPVAT